MNDCKTCSTWLGKMHDMNRDFIKQLKAKDEEIIRLQREANDLRQELMGVKKCK